MKKVFFLLFFISVATYAQKNINNYKYVIIPKQFDFLNKPDKYQTSSLTKFLFNKNGFITFFDDEQYPHDMVNNRCLALTAKVKESSSVFSTKNTIELIDCNNRVVFRSLEGKSKNKEYKKAYHEAIRNAFNSVKALKYRYKEPVREEIVTKPKPPTKKVVVDRLPQDTNIGVTKKTSVFRLADNTNSRRGNARANNRNNRISFLYAKRINNGYEILNAKREFVFTVLETNLRNVFIIKNKNGILYKENNNWIADFYDLTGSKVIKEFDIRVLQPTRTTRTRR